MDSLAEDSAIFSDLIVAEANDNVLMRIRRLSRAATEIFDAKLRPFGISAIQFSLLEIIGRMQPTTRADIARKQELDKSTLTRDLKSIFSEGWVEEVQERGEWSDQTDRSHGDRQTITAGGGISQACCPERGQVAAEQSKVSPSTSIGLVANALSSNRASEL